MILLKIRTRSVRTFAFSAVTARRITTKLYDGIDPNNNDNFKDLRDRRDKNGESCDGDDDVDDSSFQMCHLQLRCRPSGQERNGGVFAPSRRPFPPFLSFSAVQSRRLVAKHEKRLVALEELFRSVGWNCSHERTPLHSTPPSIALLLPPPTFSVLNEVLPLLSYSLGRSAKRHIRRCWSTKYGGRDRTTGTKNRAPHSLRAATITILVVRLRLRRRFLTSPVRLSAIRYNAVMSQRLRAILS